MPRGRKEIAQHAIKKGEPSRNPSGRPAGLTELRKHGAKELAEKMHALMKCTKEELKQAKDDQESDMLTVALANIMLQAAEKGDITKLNFIVERVAGSVPKNINVNGTINNHQTSDLSGLSDEELRTVHAILKKGEPTKEAE